MTHNEYIESEIDIIHKERNEYPHADNIRIVISYNGKKTNSLNITREQLCAIKNALTN